MREAAIAATSDDTARRIREATIGEVEKRIVETTSPSVLIQIDEAMNFGADLDPVIDAVEAAVRERLGEAVRNAEFVETVVRNTLANPRVIEAIDRVRLVASEVGQSELERLRPRPPAAQ